MWLDLDLWQIRKGNRFNIISYLKETYVQHSHAFQLCIPNCTYSKSPGQLKYSSCRELTLVPLQMVEIIWHLQAKVRLLYIRIKKLILILFEIFQSNVLNLPPTSSWRASDKRTFGDVIFVNLLSFQNFNSSDVYLLLLWSRNSSKIFQAECHYSNSKSFLIQGAR